MLTRRKLLQSVPGLAAAAGGVLLMKTVPAQAQSKGKITLCPAPCVPSTETPAAAEPMHIYGYLATNDVQTDGFVWDMDAAEKAIADWIKGGGAMQDSRVDWRIYKEGEAQPEPINQAFAYARTPYGIYIGAEIHDPWDQQLVDSGEARGLAMSLNTRPGWINQVKQANPDGPWVLREFDVMRPFISPTPTDTGATIDCFVRPDRTFWRDDRSRETKTWVFPRANPVKVVTV